MNAPTKGNYLYLSNIYRVASDAYSLHLEKKTINTQKKSKNYGKEKWDKIGYYMNLSSLVKAVGEDLIHENIGDIKLAIQKIGELKQVCDELTEIKIKSPD